MTQKELRPVFEATKGSPLRASETLYGPLGHAASQRTHANHFVVPVRSGRAWSVRAGQICRVTLIEGPQIGDLNLWHRHNAREKFWASRTKQLHGAHMQVFDRFWSVLPWLRPMATVIADSVQYGVDVDGAGCHDLLGTRCDPYNHKLLTGEELDVCCHSNLVRAVAPYHLEEGDVHDVLNIFQVTGLAKFGTRNQFFLKPCPAKKGDFFEFFAEIDLLCAISTCPNGDLSISKVCNPLGIDIYDPDPALLAQWSPPPSSDYAGLHGMRAVGV